MANKLGQLDAMKAHLEHVVGHDAAEKVMEGLGGLKPSVKDEALAMWVKDAVDRMDAVLPEAARNEVMASCGKNCSEMNARAGKKTSVKHHTIGIN